MDDTQPNNLPPEHDPSEPVQAAADEAAELQQQLDPAQQSLNDALRVSFFVLKVVIILLLVGYVAVSGFFNVREQEAAVRLRFGEILTNADGTYRVYGPGWHYALPYPIEEHITVPVTPRDIQLDEAFMYQLRERDRGRPLDQLVGQPLNPETDGSLVTGDANIVHARFSLSYVVSNPALFIEHVGLARPGVDLLPGSSVRQPRYARSPMAFADVLVRNVAEQGIIHMAARSTADEMIKGASSGRTAPAREHALRVMQQRLDELSSGLTVMRQTFSMDDAQMPLSVRRAYQAVIDAESERANLIERARQQRNEILGEAGGEAALPIGSTPGPLVRLIDAYQDAVDLGQQERVEQLDRQLTSAFESLQVKLRDGSFDIGGSAANSINQARQYRTDVVQRFRGAADQFQTLLGEYQKNPELFVLNRWQEARAKILRQSNEIMWVPPRGQLYLEINRDPDLQERRERERIERENEAMAEQAANP